MKFICRLIILFCIFIIAISGNAFCSDYTNSYNIKQNDTISSVNNYNHDLLNSKDNEPVIQNLNRNSNLNIANKEQDSSNDSGLSKFIPKVPEQYTNLLSYIYTKTYLENKEKTLFAFISSEIQPNAP